SFSPRLGVAYRITPKLVLRYGHGILWERVSNQMALQLISNLPFVTTVSGSGAAISTATFQNPFSNLPPISAFPITPIIYGPPFTSDRPASGVTVLDPGIKTPYLQQYSMNMQY